MDYQDVKTLRKKYNISQIKLAEISGFSPATISAWELGKILANDAELQIAMSALHQTIDNIENRMFDIRKKRIQHSPKKKSSLPKPIMNADDYYERLAVRSFKTDTSYVRELTELYYLAQTAKCEQAPKAIALFSGCGGLSLGFAAAGFNLVGHVEIEPSANVIYKENFKNSTLLGTDICTINENNMQEWKKRYGTIDLLIGGPPCQGFSLAGKRDPNDLRSQLYRYYVHMVSIIRPKIFVMENVRLLTSMKTPDGSLFLDHILLSFEEAGYTMTKNVINACNYGVPQSRERVIFVGIRNDINKRPFIFPEPTFIENASQCSIFTHKALTFRDATYDLPLLESGETSSDPLHWSIVHPDHVIKWLKDVPEGCSAHDNEDPSLRPPSGFNTTYKRLLWDEPCSTVPTNFSMISGCRNVHPISTRSLTIREAMRAQSFPDEFVFIGKWGDVRKAIGNAVPPILSRVIADALHNQFFKEDD